MIFAELDITPWINAGAAATMAGIFAVQQLVILPRERKSQLDLEKEREERQARERVAQELLYDTRINRMVDAFTAHNDADREIRHEFANILTANNGLVAKGADRIDQAIAMIQKQHR